MPPPDGPGQPTAPLPHVVAVAAYGLAGSRLDLPSGPLPPDRWARLLDAAGAQGLLGYLAAAVSAGFLGVTDAQADELAVVEAESAGLALLVEQRLVTLATSLSAAGIGYRVIDGPARTQLGYADACIRHFDTVDIVVEPGYVKLAAGLKGPNGGHFRNTCRARRRPRIGVRATVLPPGDHDAIVDLSDLPGVPATVTLGGHRLPALTPEEQLVCAAVEVSGWPGDRHIALLRDVGELVLSPGIDAVRTRRLAEGWEVAGPVVRAIRAAWATFDLADKTALSVWAHRYDLGAERAARQNRADPHRPRRSVAGAVSRLLGRRASSPGPLPTTARFR